VAVRSENGSLLSAQDNSDAALVEAIAAGDKHALQVLYGRHHVKVYRFALRFLRDESTAEDMVSEVFIDVWRQADRFERRCQVSTWLLAIARNKAFTALRSRHAEALDDTTAATLEDPANDPELELQAKDRSNVLRRCLTQLSPEHREMIDLVYYHEKSINEVAEIVGIPLNTVKTRTFYARKRLSELLAAEGVVGMAS
jgi:RNA polymerase sigma-70 factor (ECF subfamily)